MDKERDSSLTADSPWRRGLLLLISLLAAQGDAGDLEELRQRDLSMEDLQRALHPYLLRSLRQAAEAMALAIGAVTADTLRFAEPSWPSSELHGTHAVLRRLDRVWSGPALISLDASHELTLAWPGGSRVPVLVLRGYALCGPRTAGAHESLELGVGSVLWVRTGSLVLLPHGPAQELLDAAAAAGYAVSPLVSECLPPGPSAGCRLQAGDFMLDEIRLVAQLNGRSVPLTHTEMRALAALAMEPGAVISRDSLQTALGLAHARRLDPLIVSLRNKLGDGVIRTVYGSGYALDAK